MRVAQASEADQRAGAAEMALMLLADARWPAGGHAQSGGLEAALHAGMPPAAIPAYLRTRLRTVTLVEAGAAVVALHRFRTGGSLQEVEDAWAARTPSDALRQASTAVGRGYLRLVRRLWPEHPATVTLSGLGAPSRACAMACAAVIVDLAPAQLVRLVCYDDAQTVASAALKLTPLDPLDAVAWTLGLATEVQSVVDQVALSTEPDDIPAAAAPLIEQWAQAHRSQPRRLFRA
jgi:urease accessory protein